MDQDDGRPEQQNTPPTSVQRPPLPFPLVPRLLPPVMALEPTSAPPQPGAAFAPEIAVTAASAHVLPSSPAVLPELVADAVQDALRDSATDALLRDPGVPAQQTVQSAPVPAPELAPAPAPSAPTRPQTAPEPFKLPPAPVVQVPDTPTPIEPAPLLPVPLVPVASELVTAAANTPLSFQPAPFASPPVLPAAPSTPTPSTLLPPAVQPRIPVKTAPTGTRALASAPARTAEARQTGSLLAWIWRTWRIIFAAAKIAVVALIVWYIVMAGLIATYRTSDPNGSALMTIRWLGGQQIDQTWVPLSSISPSLRRAVVVSEDGQFCRHKGFDFGEIRSAMNRGDGFGRGASTISQQLAKNLFLWPDRSYIRKALEVPLTITIEYLWPKSRIFEVYLNVVEWGPGIFGAEAAARAYFDKPASQLSEREAALLAVALPNPLARDASDPEPLQARLATRLQSRMRSPVTFPCILSGTAPGIARGNARSLR